MGPDPSLSYLRFAGLAAWALTGVAIGLRGGWPGAVSAVAWLSFAPAFLVATRSPAQSLRVRVGALAAQSLGALLLAPAAGGLEGLLLAVIAGQLPFTLRPAGVVAWCAVQTALLPAVLVAQGGWRARPAALLAASFAAFEAFAAAAAMLADREARGRAELARVNEELLATRERLATASRSEERVRIARDLHDSAGHHLTALALQLEAAVQAGAGPARERVEQARSIARLLLADIRSAVSELREEGPVDLAASVRRLAAGIESPRVQVTLPDELWMPDARAASSLSRCVQEILTNAVRHAQARTLALAVRRGDRGLFIEARDDGRGAEHLVPGNGLAGLRERVERLGGTVTLHTSAGAGFAVEIWVPELEGTP